MGSRVAHYTFVSSISAYADLSVPGIVEDVPTSVPVDANEEQVTGATYGPLKGACERAARECGPSAVLVVRPGLIVGPDDPTGRFGYWVARVARGGEILAPGNPKAPLQFIDVRDLAAWLVTMAEARVAGTFNAVGPDGLTWKEMLATAARALRSEAKPVWVTDRFLGEQGAKEWTDLPFYLPPSKPEVAGLFRINGAAARGQGLRTRPLEQTVADAAEWLRRTDPAKSAKMGLSPAREAELLKAWRASSVIV
jgi:2'-hydroxyisoflavone reductase